MLVRPMRDSTEWSRLSDSVTKDVKGTSLTLQKHRGMFLYINKILKVNKMLL